MMRSADGGELMRTAARHDAASPGRCRGDRAHRRRAAPAQRGPHDPAQRHPRQDGHDRRRRPDGEDPEGPHRVVLPRAAGPAPADRRRAARGGHAGLRRRRQHPPGRRPGRRAGRHRDQQERGVPDLRPARRRGRRLAHPAAGRARVPLRVPGRDLLQGPRQPAGSCPRPSSSPPASPPTAAGRCWAATVGDSETEAFWTEFLRGLRDRGLGGVQLVISDATAA